MNKNIRSIEVWHKEDSTFQVWIYFFDGNVRYVNNVSDNCVNTIRFHCLLWPASIFAHSNTLSVKFRRDKKDK